jgi:hypothetical protein
MELPACSQIVLCPGRSPFLCAVPGFLNFDLCLDFCGSVTFSVLPFFVAVLRAVFFVAVSMLAVVVVVSVLTRGLCSSS